MSECSRKQMWECMHGENWRGAGGEAPWSTADALHKQVDKYKEQRKSGGLKVAEQAAQLKLIFQKKRRKWVRGKPNRGCRDLVRVGRSCLKPHVDPLILLVGG